MPIANRRWPTAPFALVAALASAAVLFVACGSDDGAADADPKQLLEQTFGGGGEVDSGRLSVEVSIVQGGEGGVSLDGSVSGPFDSSSGAAIPKLDLDASIAVEGAGQDFSFDGGLTSTGEAAFVSYRGVDYAVPDALFEQIQIGAEAAAQQNRAQAEGTLAQLGIDPASWLTDLRNEGTEEVEGVSTVHITGAPQVERILADLGRAAERTGQGQALPSDQSELLASFISEPRIDVYTGADDRILRRLELAFAIAPAGSEPADLELTVTISDVNSNPEIEPPADSRPLSELLGELGLAEQLGGGLDLGGGGGSGGDAADRYLDCVEQASTTADFRRCAELAG